MKRKAVIILCVVLGLELIAAAVNHWFYSYDRIRTRTVFSKTTLSKPDEMDFVLASDRYRKYQRRNLINFPVGLVSYFRIRSLESGLTRVYEDYLRRPPESNTDIGTHDEMLMLYKAEAKFAGFHNLHEYLGRQTEDRQPATRSESE